MNTILKIKDTSHFLFHHTYDVSEKLITRFHVDYSIHKNF